MNIYQKISDPDDEVSWVPEYVYTFDLVPFKYENDTMRTFVKNTGENNG